MIMECDDCKYKFKLPRITRKYLEKFPHKKIYCSKCGSENLHEISSSEAKRKYWIDEK